jgi:3-isopropylmalate/(R)-2-methylmalate dehydratase small subunit
MDAFKGRVFKFGDNIDTDQIYPGRFLYLTGHEEIAKHVMEGADPDFRVKYRRGDVVVAGRNFGCGSSREHAVITLKASGVGAVLAESFARIFYRNAINNALPVLAQVGIQGLLEEGEEIQVDLAGAKIIRDSGEVIQAEKLSDYMLDIYRHGGVIPMYRAKQAG